MESKLAGSKRLRDEVPDSDSSQDENEAFLD